MSSEQKKKKKTNCFITSVKQLKQLKKSFFTKVKIRNNKKIKNQRNKSEIKIYKIS